MPVAVECEREGRWMQPFVLTIDGDQMRAILAEESVFGCVGIWREVGQIVKFCLSPQTNAPWPDPLPRLSAMPRSAMKYNRKSVKLLTGKQGTH